MTTNRPLIFGEVLFDIFEDGESVLGGAPFNVAWHLHGFGANPLFVSRIGDDPLGWEVTQAMQEWGLDQAGLQVDTKHPTGRVTVALQAGQPSFTIDEGVAYDYIDTEHIDKLIRHHSPALIYHGSLITRHQVSRSGLLHLRSSLDSPVFIDINLRAPWHSKEQAEGLVHGASWLKLNEDELQVFAAKEISNRAAAEQAARELLLRYGLQFLVATMGEEGAFIVRPNEVYRSPPAPTEDLIDTVGAGDALSSVILLGILKGWDLGVTLQRAVAFASAVCEQRGATSFDVDLYKRFLQQWNS